MKWFVVCVFLCLVREGEFGAYFKKGRNSEVQSSKSSDDDLEPPEYGPECLAGSKWMSRCNECHCTQKGRKLCTNNKCDSTNNEPERHCAPNTYWQNDCNRCFCTDTGVAGCTAMGCIHLETTLKPAAMEPEKLGKECAIGTKWNNSCNECVCAADGRPTCTEKACSQKPEKEQRCAPNSNWKNECNTCWCDFGSPVCSHVACDSPAVDIKFDDDKVENKENTLYDHRISKRENACKPNLTFKKECNFCKCSSDGINYHCTQNECMETFDNKDVEVFMESQGKDHIERHAVCEPTISFKIRCNDCICNTDGSDYACTNKDCPVPEDVELFHELTGLRLIKKSCRPGEVLEMDCNVCICNDDAQSYSCTRRACYTESPIQEERMKNVTARKSRTKRATPTPQPEAPKACNPGQEFRMDCNTCLCDNEGQDFSCTRNDCNNNNNNNHQQSRRRREVSKEEQRCTPGSVFERECNVCRCSNDGRIATCTVHRCDKTGEVDKTAETEAEANFRCNPGEQFKRSCNDCTCSADGKSVFCTIHFCDEDIGHVHS